MKQIALRGKGSWGKFTLVDDEDFELLDEYKWYFHHNSVHMRIMVNRYYYGPIMPRIIMNCPNGMVVDHINHNPLDNQKYNLRIVTTKQNNHNARGHLHVRKFQYKGVKKHHNRWVAGILGKYIGIHPTAEGAARIYNEAAKSIFGEFAYLNPV